MKVKMDVHESHRAPGVVIADGKLWQCSRCGETVPYDCIILPRKCRCGSWSYQPVYDHEALKEVYQRRSA